MNVAIYSSPLVRTRIGFVIVPPGVPALFAFPYGGDFFTKIIDVCGSMEVEFEIPFLHHRVFLDLVDRPAGSALDVLDTRLQYFYLTNITGPTASPPLPILQYWISGPKVEFMNPDLQRADTWVPQGLSETLSGEIVEDVKTLCLRGVLVGRLLKDANGRDNYSIPTDGLEPSFGATRTLGTGLFSRVLTNMQWNYYLWMRQCYVGYRGGSVYRLLPDQFNLVDSAFAPIQTINSVNTVMWESQTFQGSETLTRSRTSRGAMWTGGTETHLDISIPDRTRFLYKSTRKNYSSLINPTSCLTVRIFVEDLAITDFATNVIHSAADDVVMAGYLAPPPMKYRG